MARPGRWRYSQVFAWGDQQSFGFDGTRGWVADTKSVGPMEAGQLLDLQVLWDPRMPGHLSELFPTMEVTGTEKTEAGEITKVRATSVTEGWSSWASSARAGSSCGSATCGSRTTGPWTA